MKPVDQTVFREPRGNCLQACIASVLELDLEDVPNFMEIDGNGWYTAFQDFLAQFDLESIEIDIQQSQESGWCPAGYHLITGESDRGLFHCVVGLAGQMVHDPHPDRTGLPEDRTWIIFVAKLTRQDLHVETLLSPAQLSRW